MFTLLGFIALTLLAVGAVSASRSESPRWAGLTRRRVSVTTGVYCAAVMVAEPFLDPPREAAGVWVAAAWATPLVAAGMVLARVRCWWGAAGAGVFLFAYVWLVALNMHMIDHSGFLTRER